MANTKHPFRFDRREMVVICSLFIFTSLLMFTVGIVVGKSVAQNKSDTTNEVAASEATENEHAESDHGKAEPAKTAHAEGTSVSTDHPSGHEGKKEEPSHLENVTAQVSEPSTPEHESEEKNLHHKKETTPAHEKTETKKEELGANDPLSTPELELIPEKPRTGDTRTTLADLAEPHQVEKAMKNPKLQSIFEEAHPSAKNHDKRGVASVPPKRSAPPKSFAEGKYTVQVGSYPSQADATLRLEQLRKQGFPFAFMSTKELGEKKEPWYRVWLGYFPDSESAKAGGELLQQRGEVKSYLVRKSENAED